MKKIVTILFLPLGLIAFWSLSFSGADPDQNPLSITETHQKISLWPRKPTPPDTINVPLSKTPSDEYVARNFRVKYGDTFYDIIKSLGLPTSRINLMNQQLQEVYDPKSFKVGVPYRVFYTRDKQRPIKLIYEADILRPMVMDFITGKVQVTEAVVDVSLVQMSSSIRSSLAKSVEVSGAPEDLSDKILSVLAWKIDFNNLKYGDSYQVLYEKASIEGREIGSRNVLAVIFVHEGVTYRGFAFDNGNGVEYFDENGLNLSHAPLQFDLITSLYDRRRLHPVRRTYRSHLGMDLEAPGGRPVETLLDGVVLQARYGRANGNFVKIKHSEDLATQYLHLSKIDSAVTVGATVTAGQKIGEVGSTGLSSGTHLCLRVWDQGKQRDPLDYEFPRRADVSDENKEAFQQAVTTYLEQLSAPAL